MLSSQQLDLRPVNSAHAFPSHLSSTSILRVFSLSEAGLSKWTPSLPEPWVHFCSPPHVPHTPSPLPLYLVILIIFGKEYQSWISSISPSAVSSYALDPYIFTNTPFSENFSLCSSRNVWDRVSHSHKTNRQNYRQFCIVEYKQSGGTKSLALFVATLPIYLIRVHVVLAGCCSDSWLGCSQ